MPPPKRLRRVHAYPDLATYLAETGETQRHLADVIGVSQAHMSRFVAGIQVPRPFIAERLANYANIPLESFTQAYLRRRRVNRSVRRRLKKSENGQ